MRSSLSGEFGLIKDIAAVIGKPSKSVIKGIGDDTAVIDIGGKKCLLATTDTLVESVHFDMRYFSFYDLGWKALAVNLSDIASMGGVPKYALVSLGLTKNIKPRDVRDIYKGMKMLAKKYHVDIIGGDTVFSPEKISITVSVIGEADKKKVLYRKGAKIGDLIMVTGEFGGAVVPPRPVKGEACPPAPERSDGRRGQGVRVLHPEPRVIEGQIIAKSGHATAMMDCSDGLAFTVGEICRQSGTGADIRDILVPKAKGVPLKDALYSGEDFELVFTCRPKFADIIAGKVCSATGTVVSIIGKVVRKSEGVNIDTKGFEHFKW